MDDDEDEEEKKEKESFLPQSQTYYKYLMQSKGRKGITTFGLEKDNNVSSHQAANYFDIDKKNNYYSDNKR